MQKAKKHIAIFLLFVFSLVVLPAPLLHKAFANHVDTADNYCDYNHKDLGTHIETSHTSCDIFKTDSPVYDGLSVIKYVHVALVVLSEYKTNYYFSVSRNFQIALPARAPPLV